MIDFKALKGDTTDNIPGIAGVGEKTAAKLLQDYGSLDGIYEHIDEVQPEKLRDKLAEHRDDVLRWRDLVTVRADVPVELDLEAARLGDYDRDEVLRLFREYEFRSLVERLPGMTGEEARAPGELLREADRSAPDPGGAGRRAAVGRRARRGRRRRRRRACSSAWTSARRRPARQPRQPSRAGRDGQRPRVADATTRRRDRRLPPARQRARPPDGAAARSRRWPSRFDDADGRRRVAGRAAELTVGVALTDQRPRRGDLLGLAVADAAGRVVTAGPRRRGRASPTLILASGRPLVGHEVKQLLVWELARRDPTATQQRARRRARRCPPSRFDTQIAAYILNAALRSQTLASICCRATRDRAARRRRAGRRGPRGGPGRRRRRRRASRSTRTWPRTSRLHRVLDELELPLIPVLATWSRPAWPSTARRWPACRRPSPTEIARLEQEIYDDVGHQFTIGSPKQLEQVLFYELNLPRGRRTKTGFSTDAAVLEDLRPAHPAIDKILEWRAYTKLRIDLRRGAAAAARRARPAGCTRPSTRPSRRPGGCRSTDPNLQNIPIRTELGRKIRHTFVAGGAGRRAAGRRLQPDRAAHPRPRVGRRAPQARRSSGAPTSIARRPRGCSTRTRPTSRRRALDGQDGQLRPGLRHERLRPVESRANIPRAGGAGVHQLLLRRLLAASATT